MNTQIHELVFSFFWLKQAYTFQYNDFNPMLERNSNGTLTILAFPCNQFFLQELCIFRQTRRTLSANNAGNWKSSRTDVQADRYE
ncbi:hypothetical protein X798_04573 [Onchocerca flexuosa]|uniref:Uncharacterized protein n=1 Tax=Onchocerca flexuosa TaxID=387005 RepID=A0A238BSV2_9BILA|nr:hypothetical protein X798_04573 [Onchocerca flexuosa]